MLIFRPLSREPAHAHHKHRVNKTFLISIYNYVRISRSREVCNTTHVFETISYIQLRTIFLHFLNKPGVYTWYNPLTIHDLENNDVPVNFDSNTDSEDDIELPIVNFKFYLIIYLYCDGIINMLGILNYFSYNF